MDKIPRLVDKQRLVGQYAFYIQQKKDCVKGKSKLELCKAKIEGFVRTNDGKTIPIMQTGAHLYDVMLGVDNEFYLSRYEASLAMKHTLKMWELCGKKAFDTQA